MIEHIYSLNLRALKKHNPSLIDLIHKKTTTDCKYIVEKAKNGSPTLSIEKDGKIHQIHSKYNPEREAEQQIEKSELINPNILVICGFGLGYHIKAALKKHKNDIKYLIIIEKDIEAFKTALENVDLTDIIKTSNTSWVIGVNEIDSYKISYNLLHAYGIELQLYLKTITAFSQPALSSLHTEYYKTMMKSIKEAAHAAIFNYGNSSDDSLIGLENILQNVNLIIRNPGIKDLYGAFKNVPGIIVSTGPSLNKNIEVLKQAVGKSIIVACDASLKPLFSHNIKPDMTVSLERITLTGRMYEELPEDYKKNIDLAACPVIMNMAYEQWNGPKIMVYREFAHFKWIGIERGILPIGPSCSNQAFQILKAIGCDPIILIGQDCAFESITKTHADNASQVVQLKLKEEELIKVKGNYTDWVYTNDIYNIFRKHFVTDIAAYKGTCINATEGGAFIEGSKLMTLQEAVDKYCIKTVAYNDICKKRLKTPDDNEIKQLWNNFKKVLQETIKEVTEVINACDKGLEIINKFEIDLGNRNINTIEEFLEKFPEEEILPVLNEITKQRVKVMSSGKYFNLYLMHIIQMIIIHFEIELKALPSKCQDEKRCKLQTIRMLKNWFPQIRDVSRRSLDLINCNRAELYRNIEIFEETILGNKLLYDVSWEGYKKNILDKNPTEGDKMNLLFYYAKEQEAMNTPDFYKTQKDLERHQRRMSDIKDALKKYFNLEI